MSTITTVVPPFTKVPNINDSVNFESDVDIFLNEINARYVAGNSQVSEMNTVASEVNANAITTQTNKNSVDTNKALVETYKNETLGYRNEVLNYTIPTEATYDTATIDSKINAIAPFSGYMAWKENNFYFNTSSSFSASIADKNRYVKFGDKVVDTYVSELLPRAYSTGTTFYVTTDTDWYIYTLDTSMFTVGKYYRVRVANKEVYGMVTEINAGIKVRFRDSANGYFTNATTITTSVVANEIQTKSATDLIPEVIVQDQATYGLTTQSSVNAGDYVVVDRIVASGDEVYRAKTDAPSGTLLTNTTYFEVRDNLPISNQIAFLHTMDATTKSYEGISNDIAFADSSATLTPRQIMLNNGYSEVSAGLYSKGTKLYIIGGYWQC